MHRAVIPCLLFTAVACVRPIPSPVLPARVGEAATSTTPTRVGEAATSTATSAGAAAFPAVASPPASASQAFSSPANSVGYGRIPREAFNRLAAEAFLPLFWREDTNENGVLEPAELDVLIGPPFESSDRWQPGQTFPPDFPRTYERLAGLHAHGWQWEGLSDAERRRREAVLTELRQGRPTLIRTDLRGATPPDRAFARHLIDAAQHIERLYAAQKGVSGLEALLSPDDPPGRALFHRNQGPWCEWPGTDRNPDCSAVPSRPERRSGLYPAALQEAPDFCARLDQSSDARTLLDPFVVVGTDGGHGLRAVPFNVAYEAEMRAVAEALEAAAVALKGSSEPALEAYLHAAAGSFRTNDWRPADEAWVAMNARNSRWYLRVGPDETQFDPCARKGGFQLALARIDERSLRWQSLLEPLRTDMEGATASMAGAPYAARPVTFHLPDFISIVLNAGDSRSPTGGVVGESLPNWGPVANEGRGRTVAMTNLGTDPDSRRTLQAQAASLLCPQTLAAFTTDPDAQQLSTVLHEVAHNLGPSHEYQVNGKTDVESFGGPLAEMLEELKAQTAAMWLADWLVARQKITAKQAMDSHLGDLAWMLQQIAGGLTEPDGRSKPYGQLAAIQLGALLEAGALEWRPQTTAGNGQDVGCLEVADAKLAPSIEPLMKRVAGIKARGDKEGAEAMRRAWVNDTGPGSELRATIRARWLRAPQPSYVYAIVY